MQNSLAITQFRFINKKAGKGKYYQLPRTVYPILVSEKDVNDRVTRQIGAVNDEDIVSKSAIFITSKLETWVRASFF